VADFGGSRAKRGIAFYDPDHALCRLQVLPSRDIETLTGPGKTAELAAAMTSIIAETIQGADPGTPLARKIVCSVGAYVQDGQPVKINRGSYTWLHQISPNLREWFSQQIGAICNRVVDVEFVHDCDMAACAFAGRPHSAVIMLGTAVGAGFVPPGDRCRPVSDRFTLQDS
jgi:predicted NBD/HSP70 family sugar kinase